MIFSPRLVLTNTSNVKLQLEFPRVAKELDIWNAKVPPLTNEIGAYCNNLVVLSNIFYFHPYLGKISNLTDIFQMGWNHQPDKFNSRPY